MPTGFSRSVICLQIFILFSSSTQSQLHIVVLVVFSLRLHFEEEERNSVYKSLSQQEHILISAAM